MKKFKDLLLNINTIGITMALKFMLAKEYSIDMKAPRNTKDYNPPIKWLMSEKLDGYRARFNPETKSFVSRQNKPYNAPKWFTDFMPKIDLDGELFAGRDNFQSMGVVRKKEPIDEEWYNIKYYAYDLPEAEGTFIERYERLEIIVKDAQNIWSTFQSDNQVFKDVSCPIVLCKHHVVESMEQMESFYKSVLDKGGEGIMMKDPKSMYADKRSNYLLKYKPSFDMEAVIVGYKDGTGKYKGKLGSFICKQLINKGDHQIIDEVETHEFSTSGMDDSIRESHTSTHPTGTIITIQYSGLTGSGKPRFARYLRIRDDVVLKEDIQKNMEGDTTAKLCVHIFERISVYEKANSEPFKAKAYTTASKALKDMNDCDLTPDTLLKVKGIGKSILEKIMTIITKGMGAIMKGAKKRKTLTISGSSTPKKRTVIIKKPSTTKLADTWQDRRIDAMNRKIKKTRGRSTDDYAQEAADVYKSKAPTKKVYKSIQKKFQGLTPDQQAKIYQKRAERTPGNIHFDKKKFGKK